MALTIRMTATIVRPKPSLGQRIKRAYAKALWLTLKAFWTAVFLAVLLSLIAVSLMVPPAIIGA